MGVEITGGEKIAVDQFDEVFMRKEGHVNVKYG